MKEKIKKIYLKLLKAQCKRNWDKARILHSKIIGMELEMNIERKNKKDS